MNFIRMKKTYYSPLQNKKKIFDSTSINNSYMSLLSVSDFWDTLYKHHTTDIKINLLRFLIIDLFYKILKK